MAVETAMIVGAIVAMFVVFATTLAWVAWRVGGRPGEEAQQEPAE